MTQVVRNYAFGGERISFLLHVPGDGGEDTRRKYPLILFLHGAGERGSDPHLIKNYGLPKLLDDDPFFPFIVVSPQCPTDKWWGYDNPLLMALFEHVITHYLADDRRVYLTGASMGGYGTWSLASEYPGRFAAVVPVCGVALQPPSQVCTLKETPIWAFHGMADTVVPPEQTTLMIDALRACGGDPKVTYVEGAGHDLGTTAYSDPALFTWMRQQTLA